MSIHVEILRIQSRQIKSWILLMVNLIPKKTSSKPFVVYQRPKNRSVNKLRLNMRAVLEPKIKKDQTLEVQDSSDDEEDEREKVLESTLNEVLNNINQSLKQVPDLTPKDCPCNIDDEEDLEENTTSLISDVKGKAVAEFEPGEPSNEQVNIDKDIHEDSYIFMKEFERDKHKR